MAILIRTDGSVSEVRPAGEFFTLQEMYAMVCAGDDHPMVEAVPLNDGSILWCHEEGKLRGLTVNVAACMRYPEFEWRGDYLVGDVLVTTPDEVD